MYAVKISGDASPIEGRGIFAEEFIPGGTIVFFYSCEDRFIPKDVFRSSPDDRKEIFFRYGVEDEAGNWLVKEDCINHSCDASILSMFVDGMYCDIAVRDINIGEEITIDYGLFYSSFTWSMECNCNATICRRFFGSGLPVDIAARDLWYTRISGAVGRIFDVEQHLFKIDDENARALTAALIAKKNPKVHPFIKFSLIS